MSTKKGKSDDERACDRILVELGKRNARLAASLTEEILRAKFTNISTFDTKFEKLRMLASRDPHLLKEIVQDIKRSDGPSGKSGSTSNFVQFLERMPNLRGADSLSYTEYTGGNYKND